MVRKYTSAILAILAAALAYGAQQPAPRQPIGEIVNPSAEIIENNMPVKWAIDPAPRGQRAPRPRRWSPTPPTPGTRKLSWFRPPPCRG